jgi:DNA polymerase-3 subunit alpha
LELIILKRCACWLFREFQNKNQEIALIGLKHINLKEASDAIRQQFGKQTATVSKQSFQKIKSTG